MVWAGDSTVVVSGVGQRAGAWGEDLTSGAWEAVHLAAFFLPTGPSEGCLWGSAVAGAIFGKTLVGRRLTSVEPPEVGRACPLKGGG